jgi:hypothetical protein
MSNYFWAAANIAKGTSLLGGGSFTTPPIYADVLTFSYKKMNILALTRYTIWISIGLGIFLIVWGIKEDLD